MDELPSTSLKSESENFHNYLIQYKLGEGTFGTVYKGVNKKTGLDVALKRISVLREKDGLSKHIIREITLLRHLNKSNHPNIVRLLEVCYGQIRNEEQTLYLVFEYIDQDLEVYIEKHPMGFDTNQIQELTMDILYGVDFIHTNKVIHRDLKPQNLLVTRDGHVKLADFGLAKFYDSKMKLSPVVVTLWYRAPEILLHLPYSTPIDIWSVGCIIAELYNLSSIFDSCTEFDLLCQIFSTIGKPSVEDWPTENVSLDLKLIEVAPPEQLNLLIPNLSEKAMDLIMKMLVFNPNKRITASEALSHPFCYDIYARNL